MTPPTTVTKLETSQMTSHVPPAAAGWEALPPTWR